MLGKMKVMKLLKNKKMLILGAIVGALGGYLYWRFVGCSTGTCTITSIWWKSSLYGAFMGAMAFDIIKDYIK